MIFSLRGVKLSHKLAAFALLPFLVTIVPFIYYAATTQTDLTRAWQVTVITLPAVLLTYCIIALFFIKKLTSNLQAITLATDKLLTDNLNHAIPAGAADEMGKLATAVNALGADLKHKTEFAEQIIQGNLDIPFELSRNTDRLGHSLLAMKQNLITIKEESQKREWTTEALAKFVAVLRSHKNLLDLSNDVIINLVQTLKANQGAIFINTKNEAGNEVLEMHACYAHRRKKHLQLTIAPGDGLIGQAFLEGKTTYLKKVPDNFVRITSGLGDANPRSVLIVPLKMEEEVVGMVELASFKEFAAHEIAFAEKIGESIAHTIVSFHTAENTKRLLEESQAQTEHMRAQEEELRQNQEELQATQEEISRKYNALFSQLTSLNHQSKFDQLKSITSTKKRNIEYYFDIIRNQILTFSEDKMIVEAVKAFKAAYYGIDHHLPAQQVQTYSEKLRQYYEEEFMPKLNDSAYETQNAARYFPAEQRAIVLQHLYIAGNTFPTGKKSLLDDAGDGSDYSRAHALYHPVIRNFLEKFGYYDIFLIDSDTGNMLYSVFKEVDFATCLLNGAYHRTNFGRVVKEAIDSEDHDFVRLIDFEPYAPSYRAPASFIACPVYDGDTKIGVLVFQMPINKINQILTGDNKWKEDGLGESGETFIAGSDYKLRTIARELLEHPHRYFAGLEKAGYDNTIIRQIKKTNTNILLESIKPGAAVQALKGITGTQLETNNRGESMLNAFAPLNIPDVHWMIMSTMKEDEASERINSLREGNLS